MPLHRLICRMAVAVAASAACAWAQMPIGSIQTIAGGGVGDNGPAAVAMLLQPNGVAVDGAGNVYIADSGNDRIRKVTPAGTITTIAGDGFRGFQGDGGPAIAARLHDPADVAVDAAGNVYFSDHRNHRVRRVDVSGNIATVAGNGTAGFSGDGGAATAASLNFPRGVAIDDAGALLIADWANGRVRKVAGGTITTVAGNPSSTSVGNDGPAVDARLEGPWSVVADGAGGFFVSEGHRVRRVSAAGIISAFAGTGSSIFTAPVEGTPAVNATVYAPRGLARDAAGNVYIALPESFPPMVLRVDTAGLVRFASGDGSGSTFSRLGYPMDVAPAGAGKVFVAARNESRVTRVDAAGTIEPFAGLRYLDTSSPHPFLGDGGDARDAAISSPTALAVDAAGNLYVGGRGRLRKISPAGIISTAAGDDRPRYAGDGGPATAASFNEINAAATGPDGAVYVSEASRVRRIGADGVITTVAGSGTETAFGGDGGPAVLAKLGDPEGMAVDAAGSLYIADLRNARVRRVADGVIRTIAGNGNVFFTGDGVPAVEAGLHPPLDLALGRQGDYFVLDGVRVRRVDAAGIITTVAGTGSVGYSGDGGPATAATLHNAGGLAADALGNLYIADRDNHRVRMVDPGGIITTIAGNGAQGFSGDAGPATSAQLSGPTRVAVGRDGGLFILDAGNQRVRKVQLADRTPDAFALGAQEGVPLSTTVQSAAVTPGGFSSATPITVADGEYSIGCSGAFTATAGTLQPGESVCVRHTSSAVNNRDTVTVLNVGGVPGRFTSTTVPGPGAVDALPVSLDFGEQWTNTLSEPRLVTLGNPSGVPVSINALRITGPFRLTGDCASLPPGGSCSLDVTFAPAVPGAAGGALTVQATSGTLSIALSGAGIRSLTSHYYESILGRAPDVPGRAFWDAEAARMAAAGASVHETWFAMAMTFFFSPEYTAFGRDDAAFVTDLYRTFFDREPDAAGLSFWSGQLADGLPREVLLAQFMFSQEFRNFTAVIFGPMGVRAEVDMVMDFYRGLLSRLPDDDGLAFWIGQFRQAQCSGSSQVRVAAESISSQFIASGEYIARNRSNAQFVGDLYNAFFRRGGDLAGVRFWIDLLDSGQATRDFVRSRFVLSQEFQARVSRVLQEPCLP